jgi:hypothetical protein
MSNYTVVTAGTCAYPACSDDGICANHSMSARTIRTAAPAANASATGIVRRRPARMSRADKARALVAMGECETLAEARIYLTDMGE